MQSNTTRLQCEESFCSLSPLEVSPPLSLQQDPTATISPPHHHYSYYPPLPPPHLPPMTGMSPCQFQISPLFEWNMSSAVEAVEAGIEEYSFFTTHPQFTPSPPMSRPMFPPPPLHHLYWQSWHSHTHTVICSYAHTILIYIYSSQRIV